MNEIQSTVFFHCSLLKLQDLQQIVKQRKKVRKLVFQNVSYQSKTFPKRACMLAGLRDFDLLECSKAITRYLIVLLTQAMMCRSISAYTCILTCVTKLLFLALNCKIPIFFNKKNAERMEQYYQHLPIILLNI